MVDKIILNNSGSIDEVKAIDAMDALGKINAIARCASYLTKEDEVQVQIDLIQIISATCESVLERKDS